MVQVFFATDRAPASPSFRAQLIHRLLKLSSLASIAIVTVVCLVASYFLDDPLGWLAVGASGLLVISIPASVYARRAVRKARALGNVMYGADRGPLRLGECSVSIPADHRTGNLEGPYKFLLLELPEDASRHVVVRELRELPIDSGMSALKEFLATCPRQEILVFIHGFNVTLLDALRRTAQIAYDLKFEGLPLCFSWPSEGLEIAYTHDEANVDYAAPHLGGLLTELAKHSSARRIHVIAHSMGNRVLSEALLGVKPEDLQGVLNQVVLAAADIDAEVFENDIAPRIRGHASRFTLYASSNDKALRDSKLVHGYRRLGDTSPEITVCQGLDTVDASLLDTNLSDHSYYGDNESVVADLYYVITTPQLASQRFRLKPKSKGSLPYWFFQR